MKIMCLSINLREFDAVLNSDNIVGLLVSYSSFHLFNDDLSWLVNQISLYLL